MTTIFFLGLDLLTQAHDQTALFHVFQESMVINLIKDTFAIHTACGDPTNRSPRPDQIYRPLDGPCERGYLTIQSKLL